MYLYYYCLVVTMVKLIAQYEQVLGYVNDGLKQLDLAIKKSDYIKAQEIVDGVSISIEDAKYLRNTILKDIPGLEEILVEKVSDLKLLLDTQDENEVIEKVKEFKKEMNAEEYKMITLEATRNTYLSKFKLFQNQIQQIRLNGLSNPREGIVGNPNLYALTNFS